MSKNYPAGKPMGNNSVPMYDSPPAFKAISRFLRENAVASSVVTLTHNTTAIEITTQTAPTLIRWIATGDTEASVFGNASIMTFDHVIPAATNKRFVVPVEIQYTGVPGSMVGANIGNGLFRRVAYVTQGIASVALAEYGSSNSY
jgi:hypothetical protein